MASRTIIGMLFLTLGVLLLIQQFAKGEPSDKTRDSDANLATGTIVGSVDHALLRSDNAVVYIKTAKEAFASTKNSAVMDQVKMTFTPKILPVLAGTTVTCPNSDNVQHNINSPAKSAKPFDIGVNSPGESKEVVFTKPGVVPLLCNLHAEMSAFILVLPNPYFTKTDSDGHFKIENVPPGRYKLAFWHEKLKAKTIDVTIKGGSTTTVKFSNLEKGKYSVELLK